VKSAAGIMADCGLVPACTLITGLPEETEDDVIKTIELIEDLKWFKSLIVPLFFVPMGRLKGRDWFKAEQMTASQIELFLICLRHDLRWAKVFMDDYLRGKPYAPFLKPLYKFVIWATERRARKEGALPEVPAKGVRSPIEAAAPRRC